MSEITIPACEGRSFVVEPGQLFRLVAVEGPQAADLVVFNATDLRESLSVWLTRQQSGSFKRAETFFSKLPAARPMLQLESAPPDSFWLSPGRCNRLTYERRGAAPHLSCQSILAAVLAEHGIDEFDVPEVLNVFMAVRFAKDGTYAFGPSPIGPGDYVSWWAQMQLLVAISACPDDAGYNAGKPKALKAELWN